MTPMNGDPQKAEIEPQAVTNGTAAARPLRRRQDRPVHPPQFEIAMAALNSRAAYGAMHTYDYDSSGWRTREEAAFIRDVLSGYNGI
jgi:hypothetical protein